MKKRAFASIVGSIILIASFAMAPAASAAPGTQSNVITVCKSERLNTVKASGQALSTQELDQAVKTVRSYCDSLDRVYARDSRSGYGTYLTVRATADPVTGPCGCTQGSWTIKVTAVGLPQANNKNVNLIWRTNAPGASGGAWQSGPSNYVGPTTTYANLPLQAGVMPHRWRVEGYATFSVGSTTRDTASAWAATY